MSGRAELEELFAEHVREVSRQVEPFLASHGFEGILLGVGSARLYARDDQEIPFRPDPHAARWTPFAEPDQWLLVRPGRRTLLVRVEPRDYWYEVAPLPEHPCLGLYEVRPAASREAAFAELGDARGCAYVGPEPEVARALGLVEKAIEPEGLLAALDWCRGFKTAYEVECIRRAARQAALGHAAARKAADARCSEYEIHARYLEAAGLLELETPYPNIVAWDAHASVLHYQRRRREVPSPGESFLIDAGASAWGYACDVTRTYAHASAHPVFRALLDGMDALQRELAAAATPGACFIALHRRAVRGVAALLADVGVLRGSSDDAYERGWIHAFLPHGLGHHLGLQVHDVGGRQISPGGERRDPPPDVPHLRTTRELAEGHVVTVEPGLYFIPMLLEPLRAGAARSSFDWTLVDALTPLGGIRIEDDVRVGATVENLTRPLVPGHTDATQIRA
jgi:Xaa-Pro dipeptidase